QHRHPGVAGQGVNPVAVRVAGDDIEGALADGAGGTQNGDVLCHKRGKISNRYSRANTGRAAVRLSMRSRIPPCPGRILPLSFTPRWRLTMLSRRSPSTEARTVKTSTTVHCNHRWRWEGLRAITTEITSSTSTRPPPKPSRVLPGLTSGASLRRPKARPQK